MDFFRINGIIDVSYLFYTKVKLNWEAHISIFVFACFFSPWLEYVSILSERVLVFMIEVVHIRIEHFCLLREKVSTHDDEYGEGECKKKAIMNLYATKCYLMVVS